MCDINHIHEALNNSKAIFITRKSEVIMFSPCVIVPERKFVTKSRIRCQGAKCLGQQAVGRFALRLCPHKDN